MAGARLPKNTPRALVRWVFAAGMLVVAAWSTLGTARGESALDSDVPTGAVAFFGGGACPEGWAPADEVEGRPIVGTNEGAAVGVSVGTPLGDREDRTHEHAFSATVTLGGKGVLAFDGSNDDGAAARSYAVKGATSAGASGLAFVQVQACAKL